jgi:hypothetical protein
VTGSNTCVTRHDEHLARQVPQHPDPPDATRAGPHGASTPEQAGHDTPPPPNRDSTRS